MLDSEEAWDLTIAGLLTFPLTIAFTDCFGPLISVLDGDTLEVLHNQHPKRIRLGCIDCPEKGQAYGTRAKLAASALVYGKKSPFRRTARTRTSARLAK